ncbi:Zn-dependent hydrolase [bacterium K02(2017)]|nr:Zn-dependent hydrolase [bacterium K02(2017)]
MIFKQLFDPESFTYTYLLACPTTKEAIIIDPVIEFVDSYTDLLKNDHLSLKYILDTHVHADHITGAGTLRDLTGAQSAMSEISKTDCIDIRLKDNDILKFGKYTLKALYTPGHTSCHLTYQVDNLLFTGDCLFINGCGRTDFQGGSAADQWESVVNKLYQMPQDYLVYPGHDYKNHHVSCIAQEIKLNPRFKNKTKESFIEYMDKLDLPDPKKINEAVPANEACGVLKT